MYGYSFAGFLELMQQAADEKVCVIICHILFTTSLPPPPSPCFPPHHLTFFDFQKLMNKDKKYKDYVPLTIVKDFGREFIQGFSRVMSEMGFEPDMRIDIVTPETAT